MPGLDYPSVTEFSGFAVFAAVCCLLFGGICSVRSLWEGWFPSDMPVYLKAGEYGECDKGKKALFKEPLNAWTSLFYTLFGMTMLGVGVVDYLHNSSDPSVRNGNRLTSSPEFSILYGLFSTYLGAASFLFHASHSEVWRKADAGMTSGTVLPLAMFHLWDRARPPAISSFLMSMLSIVLLLSFTYGHLPYGSSDILLPSLVALLWSLELAPRFGGVVDTDEYTLWLEGFCSVLVGVLLRAVDIKRKSPSVARNLLLLCAAWLCIMSVFLGPSNFVILIGFLALIIVYNQNDKGHIFWHFFSAFSLFSWWFMLKYRPGDPESYTNKDSILLSFLLFIAVKNAVRRIFMSFEVPSENHRNQLLRVLEHSILAYWGMQVVLFGVNPTSTWFYTPNNIFKLPSLPSEGFHLYFIVKTSCLIEDVIYSAFAKQVDAEKDKLPLIARTSDHDYVKPFVLDGNKLVWSGLALFSYCLGYTRMSSLMLLMHDLGGQPIAFFHVMTLYDAAKWTTSVVFLIATFVWAWTRFCIPLLIIIALFNADLTQRFAAASEVCGEDNYCADYLSLLKIAFIGAVVIIVGMDAVIFRSFISRYNEWC